jgi:hypothetical protein
VKIENTAFIQDLQSLTTKTATLSQVRNKCDPVHADEAESAQVVSYFHGQ